MGESNQETPRKAVLFSGHMIDGDGPSKASLSAE